MFLIMRYYLNPKPETLNPNPPKVETLVSLEPSLAYSANLEGVDCSSFSVWMPLLRSRFKVEGLGFRV